MRNGQAVSVGDGGSFEESLRGSAPEGQEGWGDGQLPVEAGGRGYSFLGLGLTACGGRPGQPGKGD